MIPVNKTHRSAQRFLTVVAAATVLALAGCAVTGPDPLTTDELAATAAKDRAQMFAGQEPVQAPITMDEAVARAIKYNLQERLAMMEKAIAENLVEVKSWDMLPKLTASAGYRSRSNDSASSSENVYTHTQSLVPSISSERDGTTAQLQATWNILDFGLSYYEAKALGNKALAAEERRRRVVADIARQTRAAWISAVSAEKLRNEVAAAMREADVALANSRESGNRRLVDPMEALKYQRDLLTMMRQLEMLNTELAKAKTQLATLMNLAPGTPFQLAIPTAPLALPQMSYKISDLETLAMVRRPEIREESYLARNAVLETRMSFLKLFPNVSLFGGLNYDSNKYLVNHQWADVGTQVSWNLFSLLSLPSIIKQSNLREDMAPLRRQALRMTVLSQVHIAWEQRYYSQRNYERANELAGVQDAIDVQVNNAARSRAQTELEVVKSRVETLLARRARDLSYAEMVNAQDALFQAAGLDTLPNAVADQSVEGLAAAIGTQYQAVNAGTLLASATGVPVFGQGDKAVGAVPETVPVTVPGVPASVPDSFQSTGSLNAR